MHVCVQKVGDLSTKLNAHLFSAYFLIILSNFISTATIMLLGACVARKQFGDTNEININAHKRHTPTQLVKCFNNNKSFFSFFSVTSSSTVYVDTY